MLVAVFSSIFFSTHRTSIVQFSRCRMSCINICFCLRFNRVIFITDINSILTRNSRWKAKTLAILFVSDSQYKHLRAKIRKNFYYVFYMCVFKHFFDKSLLVNLLIIEKIAKICSRLTVRIFWIFPYIAQRLVCIYTYIHIYIELSTISLLRHKILFYLTYFFIPYLGFKIVLYRAWQQILITLLLN